VGTRTNTLVWAVLCLSQLIYVVIVFQKPPTPRPQDVATTMFPPLFVVAAGLAAGTIWWRRRALVRPIQTGEIDLKSQAGLGRAFTHFILNLVLSQSVAIYGLVLTFLSNQPLYAIGFVAAGLALMWIHRPFAPEVQGPLRDERAELGLPPTQ